MTSFYRSSRGRTQSPSGQLPNGNTTTSNTNSTMSHYGSTTRTPISPHYQTSSNHNNSTTSSALGPVRYALNQDVSRAHFSYNRRLSPSTSVNHTNNNGAQQQITANYYNPAEYTTPLLSNRSNQPVIKTQLSNGDTQRSHKSNLITDKLQTYSSPSNGSSVRTASTITTTSLEKPMETLSLSSQDSVLNGQKSTTTSTSTSINKLMANTTSTRSQFFPNNNNNSYSISNSTQSSNQMSSPSYTSNNPTSTVIAKSYKPLNDTDSTYDSSSSYSDSRGLCGLRNLGNTCFMNSIIQCLSNTKFLLEYCLNGAYEDDINTSLSLMKGSLFRSYAALIKKLWKANEDIVNPQDFKSQIAKFAPRFVGYAQQDAEEFLSYLLKGLHEDVNLIKKKPAPIKFDENAWDKMSDAEKSKEHWTLNFRAEMSRISEMFAGQLKSTLNCTTCNYKSSTFEAFWQLAVPIPIKNQPIKLDDCLRHFMAEEILDGENKPTCSRCKEKRCCTKRFTIERLPKILVIHLKRFLKVRYNNKISLNVDYPIESLDMSKYLSSTIESSSKPVVNTNYLYDLYGISLHSGTESSGHYVAYCKHPYSKRWYCFNDSMVREIPTSALQDSNAYILFYQLRTA